MDTPDFDAEVYSELGRLAGRIYSDRGFGHPTLQPTALLHEAWAKLERSSAEITDRKHYLAVATHAMRQNLVDRARARNREKRPDGVCFTTLSGVGRQAPVVSVLDLDRALDALAAADPRCGEVAVLWIFGGLGISEIATQLDTSVRTIERAWRKARAFLIQRIGATS